MAVNLVFFVLQFCALCLCINAKSITTELTSKGYTYDVKVNGWLKLHSTSDDWLSARISCNLEGAALVLPWTGEFRAAVNKLQMINGVPMVYSGVHITQTAYYEGLYGYSRGEPSVLVEPNHARLKLCGVFVANDTMSEVDCKEKLPYVCYVPEEQGSKATATPPERSEPDACCENLGYEFSKKTGHWYKFHAERTMSWVEARRACESEGARLAVPNSDDEAKFLIGLHARYLDKEIINTDWPDWVAVGVLWENNAWRTVDGQTLDESGYKTWKQGWPGKNGNYVVMDRGGRYSNTDSVLYPYVCEKVSLVK